MVRRLPRRFASPCCPDVARVHGARRPAAGSRHRARRRRSGVGDLRPQQGAGRHASPACGSTCSGCRRRQRSTSCWRWCSALNASDGTTASSCSRRCRRRWDAAQRSGCSTRSIRPRTSTASIPVNVGRLVQGRALLAPCTPSGVIEMLERSGIAIAGRARRRHRPQRDRRQADGDAAAAARRDGDDLSFEDAGPAGASRATADILVAAIGRPGFVTPEFVKPGATVIDVGINRVTDAATVAAAVRAGVAAARRLRAARIARRRRRAPGRGRVAGALTPVPGGVGPLTIAMLLKNTVAAAPRRAAAALSRCCGPR